MLHFLVNLREYRSHRVLPIVYPTRILLAGHWCDQGLLSCHVYKLANVFLSLSLSLVVILWTRSLETPTCWRRNDAVIVIGLGRL